MSAFLSRFNAACRKARDTEWPNICGTRGWRLINQTSAFLDAAWYGALARRNAAPYGSPRYESQLALAVTIAEARRYIDDARLNCVEHRRAPIPGAWPPPGEYPVEVPTRAQFQLMQACAAVAGARSFWPKDFREVAREAEVAVSQKRVP